MRLIARMVAGAGVLALALAAAPLAAQQSGIMVETAVARDIVDRMPADTGATFPADVGKLWCWTRVTGAEPGTTLQHVWMRGTDEMGTVSLAIGGSPWRTYSSKNIEPSWTGEWRVEVRDATGNVLATKSFTVGSDM